MWQRMEAQIPLRTSLSTVLKRQESIMLDRSHIIFGGNERRRMQSAALPDGNTVRLVAGLHCPCGRELRCDPEPMGDGGFRILCAGCHADVLVYELGRCP